MGPIFPKIPLFLENKNNRNASLFTLGRALVVFIKFIISIVVANYLSPADFGVLSFCLSYIYLFIPISMLGLEPIITKSLTENKGKTNTQLGTAFYIRLLTGLLLIVCLTVLYHIAFSIKNIPTLYVFIAALTLLFHPFILLDSFFHARTRSFNIVIVQILTQITLGTAKIICVYMGLPLLYFIWLIAAEFLFLFLFYFFLFSKDIPHFFRWKFKPTYALEILKQSFPIMLSGIMIAVYMKIDQVMITAMIGEHEAGKYAVAVLWGEAWYFIPSSLAASMYPILVKKKKQSLPIYRQQINKLYQAMFLISLFFALLFSFGSSNILALFYSPAYFDARHSLAILGWAGIFSSLGIIASQAMVIEQRQSWILIRTSSGALINILLNLFLIPLYGIEGAALSTVIAYFTAFFTTILSKKDRWILRLLFQSS